MFIKLKNQVVNTDSVVEVEKPTQCGIEWWIKVALDLSKTSKGSINTYFNTEQEANAEYDRIVAQLCADKD